MPLKALVVDDDEFQRAAVAGILRKRLQCTVIEAGDGVSAFALLKEAGNRDVGVALLDMHMPGMNGLELLASLREHFPTLPAIMLTADQDVALAVKAIKAGANDFIAKPPEPERLQVSVENVLKMRRLENECTRLRRLSEGAFTFGSLIGHDRGLAEAVAVGRKAAASDISVLLTGETGTGKEVFARAIHGESARAGKPFIAVNCGAIPPQLVESTLFGHEKGSFTGAIARAAGKFREADGGTIFLDEVGELPAEAQVKLLRTLQQKEVSPVGAGSPVPVDVRVISATNRDLKKEVAEGRFREDLYFRFNVLNIHLPPLRARGADIPLLVQHFVERVAASEGRPLKAVAPDVLGALAVRPWPGNVRELENAIYRAVVLAEGESIPIDDFEPVADAAPPRAGAAQGGRAPADHLSLLDSGGRLKLLSDIEAEVMEFSLARSDGNIAQAASAIGMAKSTFYRKMEERRKKGA